MDLSLHVRRLLRPCNLPTLLRTTAIGEDFEGVEMEDGQVVSTFNTLIAMEAGNLVITTNENVNFEGEVEKWSTKMVFQTYNGIVPPADWPTEECPEYVLAKKKVSKNGKVLSRLLKQ